MARKGSSQYLAGYLAENARRGLGQGVTPGTYLAYCLRGAARSYAGRYRAALETALEMEEQLGTAIRGRSRCAGVAWYPADVLATAGDNDVLDAEQIPESIADDGTIAVAY
jgi:hypothetical protein